MPDSPTPADLDRWQALCDAATKGPWYSNHTDQEVDEHQYVEWMEIGPWQDDSADSIAFSKHAPPNANMPDQIIENFDFIAESRTALPACIAEIRRLREENGRLRITDEEKAQLLERFDQTDKPLQREIVAKLLVTIAALQHQLMIGGAAP